ncbi:ABC transporter ATP-binding protein [Candidatus Omnitrophota bacterium]
MTILPTNTKKAVQLQAVSKQYPHLKDFWAVNQVSLDIDSGKVFGVIGRNGAGKTTLLNIIAGTLTPTQGQRMVNGRSLGLFNLGIGFQDELTGRENIFLNGAIVGASKAELNHKLDSIIEFSELGNFIDRPLGTYSQGMRLRLGFSIIANLDFDILLIDEVLAVGDALFQNKCFEKLMDLRRSGKTLIITSQSMDLINRLCDQVVLLDHGCLIFSGHPTQAVDKYHTLLNTERFFVGRPENEARTNLIENTKKWAEDISVWEQKLGTNEVQIESVELRNRFGWRCKRVKTQEPLKIKVNFTVRNIVKNVHFGIAIFREDGVYCYGPNTKFDGHRIAELKVGQGHFILNYDKLLLAPGEYYFSVAIWDENETLAFAYHNGCYKLTVTGFENTSNELLNMSLESAGELSLPNSGLINKVDSAQVKLESVKLFNVQDQEQSILQTNQPAKLAVRFNNYTFLNKNTYLWVGIYRDDGIYCQGITKLVTKDKDFQLKFARLPLLPGGYVISLGVWDNSKRHFLFCHQNVRTFKMVFDRQDHGTVYLKHKWRLVLP